MPKPFPHLLVLGVVLSIALLPGCSNPRPIDVEDLIKNAPKYNGQIITVKGCHFLGFEWEELGSCSTEPDPDWQDKAIWIDRYPMIEKQAKYVGYPTDIGKPERKPTTKEITLEEQLSGSPKSVVLRGEFQCSNKPEFGHLNKYRYRFILHHVISIAEAKQFATEVKH